MDGVKVDKFGPSSFLWLGFGKKSLKEVKLLEINLWVPSNCKKKKDVKSTKEFQKEKKKKKEREREESLHILYDGCIPDGFNMPQVLSMGMCPISSR